MEFLRLESRGAVAVVTVARPQALNALNRAVLDELGSAFQQIARDERVRAVVLTGEGKAFVAGADIAEMKDLAPDEARTFAEHGAGVFDAIERLPQPVIAAVNGYALGGGCELALACDIRLASERARFGQPEVGLGIIPGFGGTQRLPRAVGMAAAMRMVLTGDPIDAQEALRIGLVDAVHAPEALMDAACALAERIAAMPPGAIRHAKRAMRDGDESGHFAQCFGVAEQRDAMAAFLDRRKK